MLSSLLALAAVAGASTAHASDKPARAISIVVPAPRAAPPMAWPA